MYKALGFQLGAQRDLTSSAVIISSGRKLNRSRANCSSCSCSLLLLLQAIEMIHDEMVKIVTKELAFPNTQNSSLHSPTIV